MQARRWLPGRTLVVAGDNGFAALDWLAAVRRRVCVITRLRLDADLFKPARRRRPGQRGRPPLKGRAVPKPGAVLNPKTSWATAAVSQWHGDQQRTLQTAAGTALWRRSGIPPVPIRWVLVHDPIGEHDPQAFLSTGLDAAPGMTLQRLVSRWRVETTFQEARARPGVETQRQWPDLAILRTTPALPGLFSLITVRAAELAIADGGTLRSHAAAWHQKKDPTFSDAIAAVRRALWSPPDFSMSRTMADTIIMPVRLLKRFVETPSLAA